MSLPERSARAAARAELRDLLAAGYFVAGATADGWAARPDLWDCLVDLRGRRVQASPAETAAGTFTLTPLHRAVAEAAARALAGDESTGGKTHKSADVRVAQEVGAVTKDALARIAAIADGAPHRVLTPVALVAAGVKEPMLSVLWEIAKAEQTVPTATIALALSEDEAERQVRSITEQDKRELEQDDAE
jgi:hypothetical protein